MLASDLASIPSHIHNWVLFLLWPHPFILSGVISPLISSSILGSYRPRKFMFQCPIFFAFSYCSWGSQGKNTEVVCHSLLQRTKFCQISPPWPAPRAWLSFIELDKAVVLVWLDWLVFCEYGFNVFELYYIVYMCIPFICQWTLRLLLCLESVLLWTLGCMYIFE